MSCTLLTPDASPSIEDIHNRMPVILKSAAYQRWLDQEETEVDLDNILDKTIHKDFRSRPVSKAVNSVKNNSPELIQASRKLTHNYVVRCHKMKSV
jgi:putative SOS response-associated peptidase YedK